MIKKNCTAGAVVIIRGCNVVHFVVNNFSFCQMRFICIGVAICDLVNDRENILSEPRCEKTGLRGFCTATEDG